MRIAVIGTGIAGMSAAWLLNQGHDVAVYEQDDRIGGHSNTVDAPGARPGETIPVDTGFIVLNDHTYPNLLALFAELGVPYHASDMTFAVSADGGRLEYSGCGLTGLFAQPSNLLRPGHWRMLRDLIRFYRDAPGQARSGDPDMTLGDLIARGRYGADFVHDHLVPMGAAIWSTPAAEFLEFPARTFIRFCENHGLLLLRNRPQWYTVTGGSRAYVERLTAPYADRIRRTCAAVAVGRTDDGRLQVRDSRGGEDLFDHVVIAAHPDQALDMLTEPGEARRSVLGAIRYASNKAVLHSDPALMPKRRAAWASWNYLTRSAAGRTHDAESTVSITYWMNRLQGLDPAVPLFVSLNPLQDPAPEHRIASFTYAHPQYDLASDVARTRLPEIQGRDGLWFCGAWCGYGFHEDGLSAGLAVAEALGGRSRPWVVTEVSTAAGHATPAEAQTGPRAPVPPPGGLATAAE